MEMISIYLLYVLSVASSVSMCEQCTDCVYFVQGDCDVLQAKQETSSAQWYVV